jgi:hypothetical protein
MMPTSTPMRYAVYGHCLEASTEFPELAACSGGTVRWRLVWERSLAPMVDPRLLGEEGLYDAVGAHLFSHRDGHRVVVDDTGDFDISRDRETIRWAPREPAWPDFVRGHLLGRVLATAMWLDGLLPLHASAVETRDGVVAFLAPKGFGKSTLALALVAAGAALVTDDTLPVVPGPSVIAWPGVHAVRAHREAVQAIGFPEPAHTTHEGKVVVTAIDAAHRTTSPRPLAALYLIDPVDASTTPTDRASLPPQLAAVGIVAHVKIGRMLGASAVAEMLQRAAAITARVPVSRLHTPRDLAHLSQVVERVLGWHGGGIA